MRKLALILSIVFILLTFVGAGYVLLSRGNANDGYAVVPMVSALACICYYRQKKGF